MPANDYYDSTGAPSTSSTISSSTLRAEFDAIETGFTAVQAALASKASLVSPTLVTPILGTPASGVATNLTGTASGLTAGNVTTNANLTGPVTSVGNATAIADNALSIAKTSGLQTALDAKSPLASPTFTGTVTLPTLVGTDTTDATSPTAAAFKTAGGLGVAKDCMFGKNVYQTSSAVGSVVYHEIRNTATSDASFAIQSIEVDSGSIADPMTNYKITGAAAYTIGIDNTD